MNLSIQSTLGGLERCRIPRSVLITAFNGDTGIGTVSKSLWDLGLFEDRVHFALARERGPSRETRVVSPRLPLGRLSVYLSRYLPSRWKSTLSEYDYAHFEFPYFVHLARFVRYRTVRVHDFFHRDRRFAGDASRGWRVFCEMALGSLGCADVIVTDSDYIRAAVSREVPDAKVTTIHPWTSDSFKIRDKATCRSLLGLPANARIILSVGADRIRKNYNLLARMMKRLPREFLLVKIGQSKTIELGVSTEKRTIIAHAEGSVYPLYYNAADVLAIPSLEEGFGMPIIEALNSGTPVIASDIPVFRETLGDSYPFLVDPGRVEEWLRMTKLIAREGVPSDLFVAALRGRPDYFRSSRGGEEFASLVRQVLHSAPAK